MKFLVALSVLILSGCGLVQNRAPSQEKILTMTKTQLCDRFGVDYETGNTQSLMNIKAQLFARELNDSECISIATIAAERQAKRTEINRRGYMAMGAGLQQVSNSFKTTQCTSQTVGTSTYTNCTH